MTKELSPLEVSKQLKDFVLEFVKNGLDRRFIRGSFDIIDTALKRLERRDNINEVLYKDEETMLKKLKAFEIIKAKPQTLYLIPTYDNYHAYLELAHDIALIEDIYSQEEFDLLREVML